MACQIFINLYVKSKIVIKFFTNIYRFRKHVEKHIKDLNFNESIEIPKQNCPVENEMHIEHPGNNSVEEFRTFNSDFKKSIISFLLDLHKNPNFSRKSVFDIQNSITEKITPICEVIKSLILDHSNELFFKEILNCISEPFSFVNTEYKFFKELDSFVVHASSNEQQVSDGVTTVDLGLLLDAPPRGVLMSTQENLSCLSFAARFRLLLFWANESGP